MGERCTCGAVLPEDARFCHKCGKPQFEQDAEFERENSLNEQAAPATAAANLSPATIANAAISFKNSRAVLISIVVAAFTVIGFGFAVLLSPLLWPLILLAAGFSAASAYRRSSTEPLTTAAGARLGWMTGLWLFLVFLLMAALISIYLASPAGSEAVKRMQTMPQFSQLTVANPHELVTSLLFSAVPTFFMVTLIPGLGGILGARLFSKGRPTS